MRVIRRLVQEQVVDDHAFHRGKARRHVMRVGIGLQDVLSLAVQALERPLDRGIQHVGNAQARLGVDLDPPGVLEDRAHVGHLDVAVSRQLVRERPHVAGALHVVLTAQRVHAHAGPPDIAGQHRKVRDRHHGRRPLAVLGHAQPVIDRAVPARREQPRGGAQLCGGHAGQRLGRLGGVAGIGDELGVMLELVPITAVADIGLVHQPLGHDHMRHGADDGDVGAGAQRQVMGCLDMRGPHDVGAARIDDDQLGPLAQALLQAAGKDRMAVRRVGPDDQHHVGLFHAVEILRPGRGAEGLAQPVSRGRMAHPRAGVGVVVQEHRTGQLLDQIGLLVGAAAGGDDPHRPPPVPFLDPAHPLGGKGQRLVPGDLAPRILVPLADHRLQDAILVGGIAIGEPPLDAAVPAVRLAVLVGHHAHQLVAVHLGLEAAADAAIGAGGDDRPRGRAQFGHRLLLQGRGRAGLHAGTAADAIAGEEIVGAGPGADAAVKAPALDGQGERPLHLVAGPHAARTDDALAGIIGEIGVGVVLGDELRIVMPPAQPGLGLRPRARSRRVEMVVARRIADVAQAHLPGRVLQLAIAIGRTGQAIQRVVADIQLHHALAQLADLGGLRVDHHPLGHGGRAGCGRAAPPLDLDHAQAARPEGLHVVAGAQLGDLHVGHHGGAHHRRSLGHDHRDAVDGQGDRGAAARRRAHVAVVAGREFRDDEVFHSAASLWVAKSSGNCVSADMTG